MRDLISLKAVFCSCVLCQMQSDVEDRGNQICEYQVFLGGIISSTYRKIHE